MTSQTRTLALGLGILLMLSYADAMRPFNNALDVLCWLAYVLAMAIVVLWPKTGKDERKSAADGAPVWAQRIDFDRLGR